MKTKKITEKTNIAEAIESNPKTAEILFKFGIGCFGCMMAHSETLGEGLSAHGLSKKEIDKIIGEINKK